MNLNYAPLKSSDLVKFLYYEIYRKFVYEYGVHRPVHFLAKRFLGLRAITRDQVLATRSRDYKTFHYGSEERFEVSAPYTVSDKDRQTASQFIDFPRTICVDRPFVCEIENAELVGPNAVCFLNGREIFSEAVFPLDVSAKLSFEERASVRDLLLNFAAKPEGDEIELAFSLVNIWDKNYWHWFIDTLTRLEGVREYEQKTGQKAKLIVRENLRSWQRESLRLLGFSPDDFVPWNGRYLKVKKLVVPSFRRATVEGKYHGLASPSSCRWVGQTIAANVPPQTSGPELSQRIFISRKNAWGRRIINEDEIMKRLAPLGFKAYVLEELSFEDEVRLLANAELVVGPHGSGLTNMIFSKAPKIVEIFGSKLEASFFYLSSGLGFKHGCMICNSPEAQGTQQKNDIYVDIDRLVALIETMLEADCPG